MEREQEWELARQLELERKMDRQRKEEEKQAKEMERMLTMEREREVFRMSQLEREEIEAEQERRAHNSEPSLQRHDNERELGRQPDVSTSSFHSSHGPGHPFSNSAHRVVRSDHPHALPQATHTHSSSADNAEQMECQLPNSPAPPPYKSPSPDSEHARLLNKGGSSLIPPPPSQFAFHPSVLGVMPDFGTTDFSGQKPEDQGASRPGMKIHLRSPRFHCRSPRLRSPQPQSNSDSRAGSRDSVSPIPDRRHTMESIQTTSKKESQANSTSASHWQPRSMSDASSFKPPSNTVDVRGGTEAKTRSRSQTPDLFQELDELLGGVEAMVSEVELLSPQIPEPCAIEEAASETEDTVIQPPPAFDGNVNGRKSSSDRLMMDGRLSASSPGEVQVVGARQKVEPISSSRDLDLQVCALQHGLQGEDGKDDEESRSISSDNSEQWLEGSPVIEERRLYSNGSARQKRQTEQEIAADDGIPDASDLCEAGQQMKSFDKREESDSDSVVIQPPSPYAGQNAREGETNGVSSSPPPIPPLPAAHLLDGIASSFEEEEEVDEGHVSLHGHMYSKAIHGRDSGVFPLPQ